MKEKYSYLSKNVFLFSLSGFVPKILSFILVPIYTGFLSTEEYGISDLITTTVSLMIPIFTLDIQDAVMRYSMDKEYNKKDVFSAAVWIIVKGTVLVILGSLLTSQLSIRQIKNQYLIFLVITYIGLSVQNTFSLFCRGIDKVKTIVVGSIINSVVTLTANILLLVVMKKGLLGYLIANSIGSFVSLAYIFVSAKLYRYIKLNVPRNVTNNMIKFSFPLIFSVIAWWVNNASDRYILSWIAGVSISGIYAVAYKVPNLLSTFQNVFAQAWSISAIKEFDKKDSDGFIGNVYMMINGSMVIICSAIMIFNIPIAKILFANDFFQAWKFVPPLLVSVVFSAMSLFIGSIFTAIKDTKTLAYSTIIGAIINTVCNLIFIPFWSAYGAALATLLGYIIVFVSRYFILRKHIIMKVNILREVLGYSILIFQMIMSFWGWRLVFFQLMALCTIIFLYRDKVVNALEIITEKLLHNRKEDK